MLEKIMEKNHCTAEEAKELIEELNKIEPELQGILRDWIQDKPFTDRTVHGFSVQSLMKDYRLEFTGALLTLDWLCKDPVEAVKALKYGIR